MPSPWNENFSRAVVNKRGVDRARRQMIRESMSKQTGKYEFTAGASVQGRATASNPHYYGDLLSMAPTTENRIASEMVRQLRRGTARATVRGETGTTQRESTLTKRCEALSVRSEWDTERIADALTQLEEEKAQIEATLKRLDSVIENEDERERSVKTILLGGRGSACDRFIALQRRQT